MKFENKTWVLRMALAGALSLGVATVAKADDSMAAAPATPAVSGPVWSAMAQELGTQTFGTWNGTATKTTSNATYGDSLGFGLEHVQVGGAYAVDSKDTLTVNSELANGFQLLDAYDVHTLSDINPGLAVKVGQFKIPFGADAYASPDQLIRTGYSMIDALIPGGKVADGNSVQLGGNTINNIGSVYDLGVELDQTYSNLTVQVAAVQNGANSATNSTGDKDYVGRVQWTSTNVDLGLSDYYQSTFANSVNSVLVNNVNTFGVNASVMADMFRLDLEAIFGNDGDNGYTGTLSAKPVSGFQPAVWYEFLATNKTVSSPNNGVYGNDLGAGLNFWIGSKTRLAFDVDFNGWRDTTSSPAADLLAVNTETVQLTESL